MYFFMRFFLLGSAEMGAHLELSSVFIAQELRSGLTKYDVFG